MKSRVWSENEEDLVRLRSINILNMQIKWNLTIPTAHLQNVGNIIIPLFRW